MRVVFVHGACVKDGTWWWHRTAELLAERDVASEAPALPSCGEAGKQADAQGPGLVEDVAAVRDVLTAGGEPTVVVAHSYGGIVTARSGRASLRSVARSLPRSSISIPRAAPSPSGRTP
jgi:pimeloyl-ACP methyl ester carboxylesterase